MTHTHQVRFTKHFTGGNLKGLTAEGETVRFGSIADAHAFIKRCLEKPHVRKPVGGSPYRIENPYLFTIDAEKGA